MPAGTSSVACPHCGAEVTERVFSAQAAPMRLVRSPGDARKQEGRNANLHERAKADFKTRRRAVEKARRKPGGGA